MFGHMCGHLKKTSALKKKKYHLVPKIILLGPFYQKSAFSPILEFSDEIAIKVANYGFIFIMCIFHTNMSQIKGLEIKIH